MSPFFKRMASGFTRFHGGVSPNHAKGTKDMAVVDMPMPKLLTVPMSQHIGAPCSPIVKVGDLVKKGQKIGEAEAFVSAPIHAPTSGKIKSVGDFAAASGARMPAVVIETDGEDVWDESIAPPQVHDLASFLEAVRSSGLVGLGGAGFPAHVKLRAPKDSPLELLVVNAAECEPYLTVDYRAMLDCADDLYAGIHAVMHYLDLKKTIIGIEDNKPLAIANLKQQIIDYPDLTLEQVEIQALPSRYPQGAEKTLIYATTGRRVPAGGLPSQVGCVVMNVTSLVFLGHYLKTGQPLVAKNLTVDGDVVVGPKNVRALIGTPIEEVVQFCGGVKEEPRTILMGGPMMGFAVPNMQQPILKNNNGLLLLSEKVIQKNEETDCIRCGRCASHCPMMLLPKNIMDTIRYSRFAELPDTGVLNCIECGSCAYECPANIPLVHYMRVGKDAIKKGKR